MSEWVWQGFEGPHEVAVAAKIQMEALPVAVVGVIVPPKEAPPHSWNRTGTRAIFAVQTRSDAPVACPDGMEEAATDIVGRLVGA